MAYVRKLYVMGFSVFSLALAIGMMGCGGTGTSDCEFTFENIDSQTICDTQAAASGCDQPGTWTATTGICLVKNCDCGGHTD